MKVALVLVLFLSNIPQNVTTQVEDERARYNNLGNLADLLCLLHDISSDSDDTDYTTPCGPPKQSGRPHKGHSPRVETTQRYGDGWDGI